MAQNEPTAEERRKILEAQQQAIAEIANAAQPGSHPTNIPEPVPGGDKTTIEVKGDEIRQVANVVVSFYGKTGGDAAGLYYADVGIGVDPMLPELLDAGVGLLEAAKAQISQQQQVLAQGMKEKKENPGERIYVPGGDGG